MIPIFYFNVPLPVSPGAAFASGAKCPQSGTWINVGTPVIRRWVSIGENFPTPGEPTAKWMLFSTEPCPT